MDIYHQIIPCLLLFLIYKNNQSFDSPYNCTSLAILYLFSEIFISLSYAERQSPKHKRHSIRHNGNIKILLQKQCLFTICECPWKAGPLHAMPPPPKKNQPKIQDYKGVHYKSVTKMKTWRK